MGGTIHWFYYILKLSHDHQKIPTQLIYIQSELVGAGKPNNTANSSNECTT